MPKPSVKPTMKLTMIQRAALDGLRQHAPHGVPPVKFDQYYRGEFFAAVKVNAACAGLARHTPPLVNSYTQGGQRRFQITQAGEDALREAEADGLG